MLRELASKPREYLGIMLSLVVSMVGCQGAPTCEAVMRRADPPSTLADVETMIDDVRRVVPELDGVPIQTTEIESETTFLAANLDLTTLSADPRARSYQVQINPKLLDDPPSPDGMIAILVHELKHIVDYTLKNEEEMLAFGLWYATEDVAAYERETDEFVLERGCATGLIAFREWVYTKVDAEGKAEKERVYYTPDEIRAWLNGR